MIMRTRVDILPAAFLVRVHEREGRLAEGSQERSPSLREEWTMDAQIGNFKIHLKKSGLHLRHRTGLGFEMTREEVVGFLQVLQMYQQTWLEQPSTTDPQTQP